MEYCSASIIFHGVSVGSIRLTLLLSMYNKYQGVKSAKKTTLISKKYIDLYYVASG
jgi:hypothetical protein